MVMDENILKVNGVPAYSKIGAIILVNISSIEFSAEGKDENGVLGESVSANIPKELISLKNESYS